MNTHETTARMAYSINAMLTAKAKAMHATITPSMLDTLVSNAIQRLDQFSAKQSLEVARIEADHMLKLQEAREIISTISMRLGNELTTLSARQAA